MAITASTLTITITESHKLNGVTYGNTTTKTIASCGEAIQRVVSVPHDAAEALVDMSTSTDRDNFVYFRVKNADASNFVTLKLGGAVTATHQVKILAGESFETTCNEIWDETASAWDKIKTITVQSDTGACDVEFYFVSK